jgi:NTE family protein
MENEQKTYEYPIVNGEKYPRIGLALGSGAAMAVCQFGVLKKIKEHNVKISFLTGSSMGATLAAISALDLDLDFAFEKAYRYAKATSINNLANFNFFHESLYKKGFTTDMLREVLSDFTFEDCKIPLTVTAVDLETGGVVLLNKGQLLPAVRASSSIPGVFEPVLMDGKYLVDGGLLEDCPINALRKQYPCDILIGVVVSNKSTQQLIAAQIFNKFYKQKKKGFLFSRIKKIKEDMKLMISIIMRSLGVLREEVWQYKLAEAKPDVIINVNVDKISAFEFDKTDKIISVGADAFEEKWEEIKKVIEQKKKELNSKGKDANL